MRRTVQSAAKKLKMSSDFYAWEEKKYPALFATKLPDSDAIKLVRKLFNQFGVALPMNILFDAPKICICDSDPLGHEIHLSPQPRALVVIHEFTHALHYEEHPRRRFYHGETYRRLYCKVAKFVKKNKNSLRLEITKRAYNSGASKS